MERERKALLLTLFLAGLLPLTIVLSLMTGSVPISLNHILGLLGNWIGVGVEDPSAQAQSWLVISMIRLPRTITGVIVGSTLAVCGAAMQGLFRNPLADPSIIGVSSGACLGAGIGIVLTGLLPPALTLTLQAYTVPTLAFIGGFLTTFAVYKIGTTARGTSVSTMLLAGIAISALSGAGMGILNFIADDIMLRNLTFWQMGSLANSQWRQLFIVVPLLIVVQIAMMTHANGLNALLLGESEARHLGFHTQKLKRLMITLTALGVGISVSLAGMIGFVGLVAPHLIRIFIGSNHRWLMPASALLGASLLVLADILTRIVISPAELPIGIVMALLGAPFFLSLLWKQRTRIE